MKPKLILSISIIWIAYFGGWMLAYEMHNMLVIVMWLITITMLPLIMTGGVIDFFSPKPTSKDGIKNDESNPKQSML